MRTLLLAALAAFFVSGCQSVPTEPAAEPIDPLFHDGAIIHGKAQACTSEPAAQRVFDAYRDNGWEASWEAMRQEEDCGVFSGRSRVMQTIAAGEGEGLDGTQIINLVAVMTRSGDVYFAVVFKKADKPEGTSV